MDALIFKFLIFLHRAKFICNTFVVKNTYDFLHAQAILPIPLKFKSPNFDYKSFNGVDFCMICLQFILIDIMIQENISSCKRSILNGSSMFS